MNETVAIRGRNTGLNIAAWLAQGAVAAMFCMAGFMKLMQPVAQLATMMPWTGQVPMWFLRTMGCIDLAGGIGIIAPALLRIKPGLTVAAAIGCVALQICASIFHLSRGEANVLWLNAALLACSAFVLWVRARKVPIAPRR